MFNNGDKVTSNLRGYYYGIPGEITNPAKIQNDHFKKYVIELKTGQKITLPENLIKRLDTPAEDPERTQRGKL